MQRKPATWAAVAAPCNLQTDLQTPSRKQGGTGGHEWGRYRSETPLLPRKTRPEDTDGYGVRRTFDPLVVGSSPTGPTSGKSRAAGICGKRSDLRLFLGQRLGNICHGKSHRVDLQGIRDCPRKSRRRCHRVSSPADATLESLAQPAWSPVDFDPMGVMALGRPPAGSGH